MWGFYLHSRSELTIQITTILRLLNSIAVEWVGMALTWRQFEYLGPSNLLNRLLARKHYPLAVELVRVYQKVSSKIPEHIQVLCAVHRCYYFHLNLDENSLPQSCLNIIFEVNLGLPVLCIIFHSFVLWSHVDLLS